MVFLFNLLSVSHHKFVQMKQSSDMKLYMYMQTHYYCYRNPCYRLSCGKKGKVALFIYYIKGFEKAEMYHEMT
jgi:hypothetical protein